MSTLREQIEKHSLSLVQLKELTGKIGLSLDYIRSFGSLAKKATWEQAIIKSERYDTEEPITEDEITTDDSVTENNPFSDNDDWLEGGLEDTVTSDNLTTKKCVNPNPDCDCAVSNSFDSSTLNDDLNDDLTEVLDDTHTIIDGEYVMKSEICNPAILQSFKSWEPWMLPGSRFYAHNQEYQILYFDLHGNCHAKGLTDQRWQSFQLETIVNCQIHDWRYVFNQNLKPTLSMLYKPTVVLRRAKLKKENNAEFRDMYVSYDRSFIIHRLANILSDFGRDDKHLLKGLFDDVLQQILTNEHNNELLETYGMNINDDEITTDE